MLLYYVRCDILRVRSMRNRKCPGTNLVFSQFIPVLGQHVSSVIYRTNVSSALVHERYDYFKPAAGPLSTSKQIYRANKYFLEN